VKTVRDALLYLFMAKIFLNYSSAVYHLLSDTPQSLNHTQWTLEKIVRYFALKKPFKYPSKPKDKHQEQATKLPTHEIEKKGFFTAQYNRALYELTIWYIDSATAYHMTCNREMFSSFKKITIPDKIQVAGNRILSAESIDTVHLSNEMILYNVRYFPTLGANFLAFGELQDYGVTYQNDEQTFTLQIDNSSLIILKTHGIYPLTANPVVPQDEHSTSQAVKEKAKKPEQATKKPKKKQGKKSRFTKGKTSLSL
jgi:hypothetical protein